MSFSFDSVFICEWIFMFMWKRVSQSDSEFQEYQHKPDTQWMTSKSQCLQITWFRSIENPSKYYCHFDQINLNIWQKLFYHFSLIFGIAFYPHEISDRLSWRNSKNLNECRITAEITNNEMIKQKIALRWINGKFFYSVHRFYFNLIWFVFCLNRNDYISFRKLYNNRSLYDAQCRECNCVLCACVRVCKNVKRSVFSKQIYQWRSYSFASNTTQSCEFFSALPSLFLSFTYSHC